MKKNDKIDRFSENLDSIMTERYKSISDKGCFLSKKFFFIFGLDILNEKIKIPKPDCKYITIDNYDELDYFADSLEIHKPKFFIERVKLNNKENCFPLYLELMIYKNF